MPFIAGVLYSKYGLTWLFLPPIVAAGRVASRMRRMICAGLLTGQAGCQDRRRAPAYLVRRKRGQGAGLGVDPVGGKLAGRRAGGEQIIPARVKAERARDRFGRGMPERFQMPGRRVDGEPGDAVMAAVADIQELRRRGQMDLRAGIAAGKPVRQGTDPLHGDRVPVAGSRR